ncbi:MAG TPA: TraB/GumN family protein [Steroidobacteraceae bacterium]|nr:TraB/GumN family protein [Steroidobacteraceae bacterium]
MRAIQALLFVVLLSVGTAPVCAASAHAIATSPAPADRLEEVVVTGEQASPALWKVTSGQHVLWILAAPPTPLSTKVVWRTKQVEAAIAGAQELILDGGISFNSRKSATSLSAAACEDIRAIPGRETSLKDVIPEDLYRRFEVLKDAFATNYDSLEQLRPWAAGFELNKHAMISLKLSTTAVSDTLVRLGWRAQLITLYTYAPYAVFMRNSKSNRMVSCLEEIVSELEADRDDLRTLEHAWSVGDVDALRELTLRQKPDTCMLDMFDNDQQATDAIAHHTEQWLAAVDLALNTNKTTFALVPTRNIFAPDGWLTALRARGYTVQEPH